MGWPLLIKGVRLKPSEQSGGFNSACKAVLKLNYWISSLENRCLFGYITAEQAA